MKPRQVIPYVKDDPLTHGVERGQWLLRHLESAIGRDVGTQMLDIGCGYGGLSIAWANKGKSAVALDADRRNLAVLTERLRLGEAAPGKIFPILGSAFAIPLPDATMDLALMIGVIEWVGYGDSSRGVHDVQVAALKDTFRVLRPGGLLVIGTKNRLFPRYFWRDAQLKVPLVNALPRRLANWVTLRLWGYPYRGYVYGYRKWKHLVAAAGFTAPEILVPIFTYQFPLFFARPWARIKLGKLLSGVPPDLPDRTRYHALESGRAGRTTWYRVFAYLGLLGLGAGSFIILCSKPSPKA